MSRKLKGKDEEIIKLYKDGSSLSDIAKLFRVEYRTVKKVLINNDVSIRDAVTSASMKNRRDYHYFENIDTEDKAYFLGLVSADGTIYTPKVKAQKQLKIQLKYEDSYILEEFNQYSTASKNLVDDKRGTMALTICSDKLCSDLDNLGVSPLKDSRVSIPPIEDELLKDYLRGLFDGDGCVASNGAGSISVSFVTPSHLFATSLRDLLESNNIITGKIQDYTTYYTLSIYSKKSILTFYNLIYNNSKVFLKRKYNRFNELINEKYGGM